MTSMAVRRLYAGGLVAVLLTAAGCGSTTQQPSGTAAADTGATVESILAELEGLDAEARRERLVELAESEDRQVTVYTSLNSELLDTLAEEFEAATGIAMATYRAGAEDVRTRVLQENEANRIGADVLAIGDSRLIPVAAEGILAPYTSPHQEGLLEGSNQEFWTIYRINLYAVAWNTDLVAEGEQPTNYEDLADPKWDGQMTLEPSDYDWFFSVSNYLQEEQGFTEGEVDEYWQQVADGADFNSGHTSTRQLLVAGEYAIFASDFSYGIEGEKTAGAPVDWQPAVEPLFATPEGVAAVATTDRPASTILMMDWLLSDGLVLLDEMAIDVAREELLEFAELDIRFVDAEQWVELEPAVMEEYDALSGGGG